MKINTKINLLRILYYFEFLIFFIIGYINPEGALVVALALAVAFAVGVASAGAFAVVLAGAFVLAVIDSVVVALAGGIAFVVALALVVASALASALIIFVIEDTLKMIRLKEEENK